MNIVGKNIKIFRAKQKMTQNELADALFVTRQTVSNYETGKSQPDIEVIIKIADVLHTDANSLIYGPPLEENRKRAIKWAFWGLAVYLGVIILCGILYIICKKLGENYIVNPILVLKLTVYPFTAFFGGWFGMHLIGIFTKLEPLNNKMVKIVRIILVVVLTVFVAVSLYFTVFHAYCFIKTYYSVDGVSVRWYSNVIINRILEFLIEPWAFVPLGAVCWLFGLPYSKIGKK